MKDRVMEQVQRLEQNMKDGFTSIRSELSTFSEMKHSVKEIKEYLLGNQTYKTTGLVTEFQKIKENHDKFFTPENMKLWDRVKLWVSRIDAFIFLVTVITAGSTISILLAIRELLNWIQSL